MIGSEVLGANDAKHKILWVFIAAYLSNHKFLFFSKFKLITKFFLSLIKRIKFHFILGLVDESKKKEENYLIYFVCCLLYTTLLVVRLFFYLEFKSIIVKKEEINSI